MKVVTTNSELETIELGKKIGNIFKGRHVVFLLDGDLAAGKTTLTKGIAKGLGITDVIKSPTFTIMKEYENDEAKLYHLDLYRLIDIGLDFDLEEYVFDKDSFVVIEWPYQVVDLLPDNYILVKIEGNLNNRTFKFSSPNEMYEKEINEIWKF